MNTLQKKFFNRIDFQGEWNVFTITKTVDFSLFLLMEVFGIGFVLYYKLDFISFWVMSVALLVPFFIVSFLLHHTFTQSENNSSFKMLLKDSCTMPIYTAFLFGFCSGLEKIAHIDMFTIFMYLGVIPITNALYRFSFYVKRNFRMEK